MRTLVVNFKNYPEVLGDGSLRLSLAVARVADALDIEGIVAPPVPMISLISSKVKVRVYSQTVSAKSGEKTTGAVLPEAVKAAGASGTILNHSESRQRPADLRRMVPRLLGMGMGVCLCARTASESASLAALSPTYVAVEPPDLIGSGVAVSKARPGLISGTVAAVKRTGFRGKILCGAGIVTGDDVAKAVELGADGVLVASSVVKAKDWEEKLRDLARSLK